MKRVAVIMAGGTGERFWPLSRIKKPKQLLKLSSPDKMMLEEAIERISPLISADDIYIITSNILLEPIRKTLNLLPPENIVAEPMKRNTAPALALSASFISQKYYEIYDIKPDDITIAVLTADQSIPNQNKFIKTVEAALDYVETHPYLATVGIKPSRPETGYGYIEVENPFADEENVEIKPVLRFREKPDYETAKQFAASGNYLWNSGMFFWRMDVFIESMKRLMPEVGSKIDEMQSKFERKVNLVLPESLPTLEGIFKSFPNTSIDYGLMEKADNVVVVKALFTWDDIGSWDSLDRIRQKDIDSNIINGNVFALDTKNSTLINESSDKVILAATGIDNMVVVVTEDAVLLCPKSKVQDVKKIVERLWERTGDKWL